jgi:hypothetical protein
MRGASLSMYLVSSSDSAAAGVVEEEVDEKAIYIVSRVFLYSAV